MIIIHRNNIIKSHVYRRNCSRGPPFCVFWFGDFLSALSFYLYFSLAFIYLVFGKHDTILVCLFDGHWWKSKFKLAWNFFENKQFVVTLFDFINTKIYIANNICECALEILRSSIVIPLLQRQNTFENENSKEKKHTHQTILIM